MWHRVAGSSTLFPFVFSYFLLFLTLLRVANVSTSDRLNGLLEWIVFGDGRVLF